MFRSSRQLLGLVIALAATLSAGCITNQLRDNTVRQADTYAEIHEQQVLNNLAKFVYDINSLPSFSWSNQATNQLQDTASVDSTTTWERIEADVWGWFSSTLHPSVTRVNQQNWTITPVNDPRKLDLMRCAYQQVVRANMSARGVSPGRCRHSGDGDGCPDCPARFNTFYTGSPTATPKDVQDAAGGGVTNYCLGTNPVWFAWGHKRDMPKHCCCLKAGHYCDVWVWVLPGGEDELAKLTLAILDYAVNAPPALPTKQVLIYLDKNGNPATQATASEVITGSVPTTIPGLSLAKADLQKHLEVRVGPAAAPNALLQQYGELPNVPPVYQPSIDEVSPLKLQQLQLRLNTLTPITPRP